MTTEFLDILTDLLKNMCNASVFYISENIHNYIDLEELEKLDKDFIDLINKPHLINAKGFYIEEPRVNYSAEILIKKSLLLENVFKISQCKDTYGNEAFNYILEKYGNLIECFLFITLWLNRNYTKDFVKVNEDLKRAFNFQYLNFKEHKIEIETKFHLKTRPILTTKEVVNIMHQKDDIILPSLIFPNAKLSDRKSEKSQEYKIKKNYIRKLKESTFATAENYLLETVFNLKLGNSK